MSYPDSDNQETNSLFPENDIAIGSVFLIDIEEFNILHSKYIIIVSENDDEFLYAFVVVNSKINENYFPTDYLKSLHIKIKEEHHSFLKYDSYADCSNILEIKKEKLKGLLKQKPDLKKGKISESILASIHYTITMAKTITKAVKKKFGFL